MNLLFTRAKDVAQNDSWLAAGKFYSAVSNITGSQYKAISAGRNNVTMTDIKETQNAFMDMAFMVAPIGLEGRLIGPLRNWVRLGKYWNNLEKDYYFGLRWVQVDQNT